MSILDLICSNGFITVNRHIASIVGLEAAVVLGELSSEYLYWQEHDPNFNGEFYSTIENLEQRTFLSGYSQRLALNKLQEQGWIQVTKKGMPAKRYIRLNEEKISEVVNDKSLKNLITGDKKIKPQAIKNFDANNNITNNNRQEEINNNISDFIPPTLEEVIAYCRERHNNVDAAKFIEYYEAGNWKDAKGIPVTNWKQKVFIWEQQTQTRSHRSKWKTGDEAGIISEEQSDPDSSNKTPEGIIPEDIISMFGDQSDND